ncbi:phage major capsid protein [Lysinibacillus odysseyi]|uniref:Capsid protein n=1 Tax=Lysinibacillus odysseyi 34hs-1 = NBRC 100172 TaxID=1220589 RepID=A0A0A3IY82_9BACI|nr:phage major capsid protein [Lysinibacillus odysseyi]KGR88405.1 capsid protein [Lysinibacillus odysseyi 34hs-1 = NBRC 100172]
MPQKVEPTKGIQNLDDNEVLKNKEAQIAGLKAAFENGDATEVAARIVQQYEENFTHYQDVMNTTIREAKRANEQQWDEAVLASRGVRQLTAEEKQFYSKAIEVESFDGVLELMPPTVYDRVFEDLAQDHPLLSRVNFTQLSATTQWVVRKEGATTAYWGDVCDEIQEMVDNGFKTIEAKAYKLSGFLVVCKAMFELGPAWLDRYVRALMTEVVAAELERTIVNGTGNKQPVGMMRNLDGAVVGGVYPEKESVELLSFTPHEIGTKILAPATKEGTRDIGRVVLILNPYDFYAKLFAYGAKQRDDGVWMFGKFPVPDLDIIKVASVPRNKMISGNPKDYWLGTGTSTLESSDHVRMIQDQRLYLTRQLVNGQPLDNEAFTVFDISNAAIDSAPDTPDTP